MKSLTIFQLSHNRKYTTFAETSHGMQKVQFEPVVGFGYIKNSIFSTNDEEVIDALKKHREYGSLFSIQEEGRESDLPRTTSTVAYPTSRPEETSDLRSLLPDPEHVIEEPSVTSVQMANNWLQRNHNCVFEATRAKDIRIEAAKRYNVIFTNW